MITKEQILGANKDGLSGLPCFYYTPILKVAHKIGSNGVNLENAEIISGFRYGKAPENFISWNYAENSPENGLSIYTEKSIVRSEFINRKKYEYTGLVSGKGSDNETLILCFDAENLD